MQKKYATDPGYPYKIWKTKPPGEEQQELNRLFEVGEISQSATADLVRRKWPIFQRFTSQVFETHFRSTRSKYGSNAQSNAAQNKDCTRASIAHPGQNRFRSNCSVSMSNPPIVTWMYADHEKKRDFVVAVTPIFSGTRDFKFHLSNDGLSVTVTYLWPVALYTPEIIFKDVPKNHPKVRSFISHMLQAGITKESPPQGAITIKLPCKVQREVSEFTNCIVQSNDTTLIMMEFVAYHTYYYLNYYDR